VDWNTCLAVTEDAHVRDWLRANGIDPEAVARRDLARAIPDGLPALVLPLLASDGSVKDLFIFPMQPRGKGTPAPLSLTHGAVMANLIGRGLLLRGDTPAWWSWRTVVVLDDLIDFLSWGSAYADAEDIPAVFLIPPNGWSKEHSRRIPDGVRVLVRMRRTPAALLFADLRGRCEVIIRK
jgi:hypothetical protein